MQNGQIAIVSSNNDLEKIEKSEKLEKTEKNTDKILNNKFNSFNQSQNINSVNINGNSNSKNSTDLYFNFHKNIVNSILFWTEENMIISSSKDKIIFSDLSGNVICDFTEIKGDIKNLKFIKRSDFLVKEEFGDLNKKTKHKFGKFSKIVNSDKMSQLFFYDRKKKKIKKKVKKNNLRRFNDFFSILNNITPLKKSEGKIKKKEVDTKEIDELKKENEKLKNINDRLFNICMNYEDKKN